MVTGNVAQSLTSIHTLTKTVLLQEVLKRKRMWQPIACHNQCCSGVWGGEYETSVSLPWRIAAGMHTNTLRISVNVVQIQMVVCICIHHCKKICQKIIWDELQQNPCSSKLKSHELRHEKLFTDLFENTKNKSWGIYLHKNETHSYCCKSHRKLEKTAPGFKKLFRRPFTHSQVSQPNSQSIYTQCSVLSSNNSLSLSVSLAHTQTWSLHGLGHDDTYQHWRDNLYAS